MASSVFVVLVYFPLTWFAVVHVGLALLARVTRLALALVAPHRVEAGCPITTGTLHAFVDVYLTCLSFTTKREKQLCD